MFLLVASFCLSARIIHAFLVQPYSYVTHLFPTHFRIDSLLFGVLLSYWYRFHSPKFRVIVDKMGSWLFALSFLLILPAFCFDQSNIITYTVGLSSLYLGYGCLMIALLQIPLSTQGAFGWILWPLFYIGQHSYPIYVFHILVMLVLLNIQLLHGWLGVVLYFVSTIAVGIIISKLIEFPVLHVRDRIFPRSVQDPVPAPLRPSETSIGNFLSRPATAEPT